MCSCRSGPRHWPPRVWTKERCSDHMHCPNQPHRNLCPPHGFSEEGGVYCRSGILGEGKNLTMRVNRRAHPFRRQAGKTIQLYTIIKKSRAVEKKEKLPAAFQKVVTGHSRSTVRPSPRWVSADLPWLWSALHRQQRGRSPWWGHSQGHPALPRAAAQSTEKPQANFISIY